MRKVFFMVDRALEIKKRVSRGTGRAHDLYGGIELEKEGKAKIINADLKSILKIPRGSIVVINRPNYIFLLKLKGIKVILITWNSEKVLKMIGGWKNKLSTSYERIVTRLSDIVVCLSKMQIKRLRSVGVKHIEVLNLGVDEKLMEKTKKAHKYYLTCGLDKGRNHDFVRRALKGFNLKILDGKNPLPYNEYLKVLGEIRGLILNINTNRKGSSGMSGSLTCTEALLMKKPIFINYQPWLKEILKENYYVYSDAEDLRKLLKKNIKFKERNYEHLTLKHFTSKLLKIIKNLE